MSKASLVLVLRVVAITIAVVCTTILPPWNLVWAWLTPLPDTVQQQVTDGLKHDFDGIIVYVQEADKPPLFYSAGWHNRDQQLAANPHALFKIASINKLYVAVAITKLVQNKQLYLDGTLAEYFPELVGKLENTSDITLRMMVQHRSGLPNFTDHPDFWTHPPQNNKGILDLIAGQPANFAPGEEYGYSNTNYMLLTELIEKAVGYSHHTYIKEAILQPLSLTNTFGTMAEIDMDRLMSGYYVGIDSDIKSSNYGSMVATAEDVGIFLRALNDGSVFGEGERDIYGSIYVFEHTGLIPGYKSIARYHNDIDTVVIQFVNTTDFSDYTHWALSEMLYNRIVDILRNKQQS